MIVSSSLIVQIDDCFTFQLVPIIVDVSVLYNVGRYFQSYYSYFDIHSQHLVRKKEESRFEKNGKVGEIIGTRETNHIETQHSYHETVMLDLIMPNENFVGNEISNIE